MLPVIHIGPFSVVTYGLVYALAALAGGSLAFWRMRLVTARAPTWRLQILLVMTAIVVGLWLPGLIQTRIESLLTGQPPAPAQMRVYYGMAFGIGALLILTRINHRDPGSRLDQLAPPFALAYAIGRLGCLAAGCCGGSETDALLSLNLPNEQGIWAQRYPTQILSGFFQLGAFFLLLFLEKRRRQPALAWLKRDGALFCLYMSLFAVERFVLDFFREDYVPVSGWMSQPQMWMGVTLAAALAGLAWLNLKGVNDDIRKL